jgi:hypothetical protein
MTETNRTLPKHIAYDVLQAKSRASHLGEIIRIEPVNGEVETYLVKIYEERSSVPRWHGPKANVPGESYLRSLHGLSSTSNEREIDEGFERLGSSIGIKPEQPTFVAMISYIPTTGYGMPDGVRKVITELESHRAWRLSDLLKLVPANVAVGDIVPLIPMSETFSFREALIFLHTAKITRPRHPGGTHVDPKA